ncbi:MAG: D-glycero-beta-D-manno-heptose 1,7-bisphosphate 7-phosphatase [Desulfobacteraceae bacterium]|nr:D-glycero-beta-D-manno-heptose 1,7-bisphosphate 7-phosphatase [Desulfobacteraceae bacterium]
MKSNKPIVFLDRDGVINQDSPDYIKTADEFEFIPGSDEAISLLCKAGFEVILITNQSMINRGISTRSHLEAIFEKMRAGVAAKGGRIKDIFYCPHAPDEGCACRKPKPGLILKALDRYGINPATAFMVGDSAKDIGCARNARLGHALLVLTGNGSKALETLEKEQNQPDFTAPDLMAAVQWIIQTQGSSPQP